MEFYSAEAVEPDDQLLEIMGNIGTLLGRVIERSRAEKALEHSRGQLRELYQRIELVREEERTRIAREVHDELGQVLSALRLELALFNKKLMKRNNDYESNFDLMFGLIDDSIKSVKRISFDLRPPILDMLGLSEAIAWLGKDFQKKNGIQFRLYPNSISFDLDPDRATALYRIFQETLTNVSRHSRAGNIDIYLSDKRGYIILVIIDDGRGITKAECDDIKSIGLLGMRERAMILGGDVKIYGRPGKGTTVIIKIPHKKLNK